MRFPFTLLGLSAQVPLQNHLQGPSSVMKTKAEFVLQDGANVFTPKDLVELSRPGVGVANDVGDLVLVPVAKYSFQRKTLVHTSFFDHQGTYSGL